MPDESSHRSESKPVVLVVDDEPAIREVMVIVLLGQGYEVLEASDGRQAVDLARSHSPALIVLDMNLPLLSGEEVAEALRRDQAPLPPILVVTASGDAAERAKRAGAGAFLPKPFDLTDFITEVARLARWARPA